MQISKFLMIDISSSYPYWPHLYMYYQVGAGAGARPKSLKLISSRAGA